CIGKLRPGTDEIIPTRKKKASVIESNVPKEQCSVTTIGPSLLLKSNCIGKHKKGCKDNGTKEAFAK
ncbi:MAG: hypothetical protein LBQ71_18795, partial [Hungatella sp.]|nr:hypothetical protein [Hungatella sp.]